jgi:RNA polymerase sigma-70 factor (ECF subfamily)
LSLRLRASDARAHDELFKALYNPLVQYARRFLREEATAFDLLQTVFMKLWDMRERLRPDASIEALLYRMMRNACIDHIRQRDKMTELLPEHLGSALTGTANGADAHLEAHELADQLETWIAELPGRQQEAFRLSRYHGLNHKEISRIMNISIGTVNLHVVKALNHLRNRLEALQRNDISS